MIKEYFRKTNTTPSHIGVGWSGFMLLLTVFVFFSCAKMGSPDGGWYDEEPPRIIGASPADKDVNVNAKKVNIFFDEYIKIENATEKVIVSPPQLEMPEIKSSGKRIIVELKDSLKPNITYTIDFSDAITDNNENNPLGNYTYSFSTGEVIDTMEVSGHVLEAENLEPVKGIMVGLYKNLEDSAFTTEPMLRISRTDSRGRFVIKGVAPGEYRIYALQDMDGNFMFSQKSEKIAFSREIIVPSFKPDIRQDTVWRDTLHIESIERVPYTHFLPDDIVLRAFTEQMTNRYFLKSERVKPERFSVFFSYGDEQLPQIKGLNFDEKDAFIVEHSEKRDTVTYWLRDTTLVNQDTLRMEMIYLKTDSVGVLQPDTIPLEILAKESYEKRMKQKQKQYEKWKKDQEKAEKKGLAFEKEMKKEPLRPEWKAPSELDPDKNIYVTIPTPVLKVDTSMVHLYSKHDTLWYNSSIIFREKKNIPRTYELLGEWRPDIEYSLEVDSAAFIDIYGNVSNAFKQGFKVKSNDVYSSLIFTFEGIKDTTIVAQLIDGSEKVVKEAKSNDGVVEFFYINPGDYYLRMFVDANKNGKWDTGEYAADRQPEDLYYYPKKIECKAKWDVSLTWNPFKENLASQKPDKITKQKGEKAKTIKKRNEERARRLGIEYVKKAQTEGK